MQGEALANVITTLLLAVIGGIGMWRGLDQLEKVETYAVSLNLGMIGALLAVDEMMTVEELKGCLVEQLGSKFSQIVIDGNLAAVERANKELVSA